MNIPPWLREPAIVLAARLLISHEEAFGRPLLAGIEPSSNPRLAAQELFAADLAVLAHDGAPDPCLVYANATALRLWRRPWRDMVGLPSRLTAEPNERPARAQALAAAQRHQALTGYQGIRMDSAGRRFQIAGARIWTVRDGGGEPRGQAAGFANWWWL
ncbi:MAG: MEKHLA domain-containing protein [Cyanobacteriota bacterium]|nr:MEKHLA domain-containing protein [Cyanobacteriota bacterium]